MKKVIGFWILAALIFAFIFLGFNTFFKSESMAHFIWNMNTFQGRFINLAEDIPKENIFGAYALSIRDFKQHSTRTVSQNAPFYALIAAGLGATNFLIFVFANKFVERLRHRMIYLTVLILGIGARLFFAYHTTCNQDLVWWYGHMELIEKMGGNIYQITNYNYSPVWYFIAKFCYRLTAAIPQLSFMFTVRCLLTLIDTLIAFLLVRLSKMITWVPQYAIALFFLNPVSIIITGYHGQIDNISVLFLLLAIYLVLRDKNKNFYLGWLLITLGIIVKHQIIQQVLIYSNQFSQSRKKIFLLFSITIICFLLSFGFYWNGSISQIAGHVFGYGGMSRPYGLISLDVYPIMAVIHKYLFISLLLIWPFIYKTAHILKSSLIGMLLFLVFTSGISTQQFVLPIALGALQGSAGFFLFSTAASLFLFGDLDELKMYFFRGMTWNYVWFCALIWFLIELNKNSSKEAANIG